MSTRHVELARASGALAPLSAALNAHRVVATCCGDFETATSLGVEEDAVKEVTGIRMASYGALLLAAYQGRPAEAIPLFAATAEDAIARGEGLGLQLANWAAAVLHNGLGHYAEALAAAEQAAEETSRPFTAQALPELIEAAVTKLERPTLAADALRRLSATTAVEGSDWAAGLEARSRALLSEGETAEQLLRRGGRAARPHPAAARARPGPPALRRVAPPRGPAGRRAPPAARRLRPVRRDRRRGVRRARAQGAARHRREGPQARRSTPTTELTPQEEHIARLARDGRTNPEIAAELFISARTVEWHLRKVFAKLGITSRKDLRLALQVESPYGAAEPTP